MPDPQASKLLARLEQIAIPADLMRDALQAYAQAVARGTPAVLTTLIFDRIAAASPRNPGDIVLAAKLRILSLACLVRDHALDEWVRGEDPNGVVLFHNSLFQAAAAEPLILLANDEIGFDRERLRRRVLELAAVKGSA